jgi:hypothetical protein
MTFQWQGSAPKKPRQVSVLLHPLVLGNASLLWRDWSRRAHRRACLQLVRDQHIEMRNAADQPGLIRSAPSPAILSRAQRAPVRLSWAERLTRNAQAPAEGPVSIKLFGVPNQFADFLGLRTALPVTQLREPGSLLGQMGLFKQNLIASCFSLLRLLLSAACLSPAAASSPARW